MQRRGERSGDGGEALLGKVTHGRALQPIAHAQAHIAEDMEPLGVHLDIHEVLEEILARHAHQQNSQALQRHINAHVVAVLERPPDSGKHPGHEERLQDVAHHADDETAPRHGRETPRHIEYAFHDSEHLPRLLITAGRPVFRVFANRHPCRALMLAPHAGVQRAALQQLIMPPAPHDAPRVHDENLVGARDGREPMRDSDKRLALHQPADGALHQRLVFGVGVGGRLVEDDDGRVLQDGARDGDALALTTRKPISRLTRRRSITLWKITDELVGSRGARRCLHLGVGRIGFTHTDVVGNGTVEQKCILSNVGDVLHELLEWDVLHVDPAELDASRAHIPEPRHELGNSRLARSRRSDDRRNLPRLGGKAHLMQNLGALVVGKRHVFELERLAL